MRGHSPVGALAVVMALVLLGFGLDRIDPTVADDEPMLERASAATSGAWYCAAASTGGESATTLTAAVFGAEDGTAPAEVTIDPYSGGRLLAGDRTPVFPSSARTVVLPDGHGTIGAAVRWWDQPAAVTRSWTVGGDTVRGLVEGPCQQEPAERWHLPGVSTAGGAEARLYLSNPFASDATVAVTLATPDGPLEPRLLENLVVPARGTKTVLLNEHAPEQPSLGVEVRTRAGRVILEGLQSYNAAIGGVEGVSLVPGVATLAQTWTVPWFADTDQHESWLWVTNPDPDEPAAIALTLHTPAGGVVPEGLEEVTVAPGSVTRIDLRGLLPDEVANGAVTVRSDNGVDILVAVATQALSDDEERTGVAVDAGAGEPASRWILSGGATEGRDVAVHLANPGAEEATVDLMVWTGAGVSRPPQLQGVSVPAGGSRVVAVTDALANALEHTIFVEARGGAVVAGRVATSREGRLHLVAATGVPSTAFGGGGLVPVVQFRPGMPQRVGTRLGPQLEDPLLDPEDEPAAPQPTDPLPQDDPLDPPAPVDPASPSPASPEPTPSPTPTFQDPDATEGS